MSTKSVRVYPEVLPKEHGLSLRSTPCAATPRWPCPSRRAAISQAWPTTRGPAGSSTLGAPPPRERARLSRSLLRRCPNLRRLPEDIDEWTIEDLRGLVVTPAPAFPAESPESKLQVTLADFRGYLESVGNPYRYLTANRPVAGGCNGDGDTSSSAQDTPSLAGVPEICFRNDFDLAQPDTFAFFSPPEQPHATMVMLERLAQWLDQVVAASLLHRVRLRDTFAPRLRPANRRWS